MTGRAVSWASGVLGTMMLPNTTLSPAKEIDAMTTEKRVCRRFIELSVSDGLDGKRPFS